MVDQEQIASLEEALKDIRDETAKLAEVTMEFAPRPFRDRQLTKENIERAQDRIQSLKSKYDHLSAILSKIKKSMRDGEIVSR